jgi:hypothetical protein
MTPPQQWFQDEEVVVVLKQRYWTLSVHVLPSFYAGEIG